MFEISPRKQQPRWTSQGINWPFDTSKNSKEAILWHLHFDRKWLFQLQKRCLSLFPFRIKAKEKNPSYSWKVDLKETETETCKLDKLWKTFLMTFNFLNKWYSVFTQKQHSERSKISVNMTYKRFEIGTEHWLDWSRCIVAVHGQIKENRREHWTD